MAIEFLRPKFIEAMNDIGRYGREKHGELEGRDRTDRRRFNADEIAEHAGEHFTLYLTGELHDHFGTRRHQLAAVAFNAMMEFYFAGLEDEA